MKIVKVDNYNRDSVADILVAENVHPQYAERIVELLNKTARSDCYFVLKSDTYRLSKGMGDLV